MPQVPQVPPLLKPRPRPPAEAADPASLSRKAKELSGQKKELIGYFQIC